MFALLPQVRARGTFHRAHSRQVVGCLRATGWKKTDRLVSLLEKQLDGVTTTKIVEDGVRELRQAETSGNFKKALSEKKTWWYLVHGQIESIKYRYMSVPWRGFAVPRGLKDRSIAKMFDASVRRLPRTWRAIANDSDKAPYRSSAPLLSMSHVEDKRLVGILRPLGRLKEAPQAWKSVLAHSNKHKIILTGPLVANRYYLSLGTACGSCVLGLLLREITHGGLQYFVPERLAEFHWLAIVAWTEWTAFTVRARSPLHVRLVTGAWLGTTCVLEKTGRTGKLLEVAAWNGFYQMPKTAVVSIGRALKVKRVWSDFKLGAVILIVAEAVLERELTEDEQMEILRHRFKDVSAALALLECADISELIDEKEVQDLKKDLEANGTEKDGVKEAIRLACRKSGRRRKTRRRGKLRQAQVLQARRRGRAATAARAGGKEQSPRMPQLRGPPEEPPKRRGHIRHVWSYPGAGPSTW